MTDWLRRAGSGQLPDGSLVTWSVAEGARGRRWRWTVSAGEGLRHAGLIELDDAGRFARLELETADGMLTLHPDATGAIAHGNVVRHDRVDPIAIAWRDGASIAIEGDPFGTAIAGRRGRGWVVEADLRIWSEDDESSGVADDVLTLDERGVPRLLGGREWPLEA